MTRAVRATPGRDDPKAVWSWAFYDWANSAFTTLVVTFIYSTYFSKTMAPDEKTGILWWSWGIAISSIIIALASPVLGAIADRGGSRKRFMAIALVICVGATTAVTFVAPGMANAPFIALGIFIIANIAYEVGNVFYNAFLPSLASPEHIGRISGYGWGLGYVGGIVCMAVALVGFLDADVRWFGMSRDFGFRATNLLVVAWFVVFAVPFFRFVREAPGDGGGIDIGAAFRQLRETAGHMRRYREIVKFLIARLIFNDGLVTLFAFGGMYASEVFSMSMEDVTFFGIGLNVSAGIGALLFGFVDDRFGGKKTILVTLVGLIVATGIAVWAPTRTWFWIAGILAGLFVGPNQSASRSLMGRFVPEKHNSEFYGFFAFSGKATAFLGPALLGLLTDRFSARVGMASVIAFFIIGGLLLLPVNEKDGMAAAKMSS